MAGRIYTVEHETLYRYARPVQFLEHRLLYRPRSSFDFDVLASSLEVAPRADVREIQDVFSNSVTLFTPRGRSDTLRVVARFAIRESGTPLFTQPIAPHAERYPFDYTSDERRDLGARLDPHYVDPDGQLYEWTRAFLADESRPRTLDLLESMAVRIRKDFAYQSREAEGTQAPEETLRLRSGTCRDFALLMMEAVRRLGMASRYVSGYLYDPALDRDDDNDGIADIQGAGATHAWMQVFLPGAGWVAFDPTNAGGSAVHLIRVAHARDPAQALPLSGDWFGATGDYLGMEVRVTVSRVRSPKTIARLVPPRVRARVEGP
jgi:transglutaminase-like putative cysteine protease